MRNLASFILPFGAFALVSCAPAGDASTSNESFGSSEHAIVYGTKDTTHTAVVAVLADGGGGSFFECSGTIVQVKNGEAYVLTAAHCCNMTPPSLVVMANDYSPYEQYLGNSNPPPPAYAVEAGSVKYDSKYNQQDHDFCMLKFKGAPANTPVIPVPAVGQDGLKTGVDVEYVGFGMTSGDPNNMNSARYHGTASVDQGVTSLVIQYSEGNGVAGPCEGDSGGPALLPAGAPQAQQMVVATTSYGDQTCSQYGVSSRVTSETGPGGFISTYLGSVPTGTQNGCTTNSQCSGSTPICDSSTGTCRGCNSNRDCAMGVCEASQGRCVQCASNSDCPAPSTCDTSTNTCAQCTSDAQCSQLKPVCDTWTEMCRGCSNDADCASNGNGQVCATEGQFAGACVTCSSANSTACGGSTPACDAATGTCVECASNSDCTDPTKPACNTRTHACFCLFDNCGQQPDAGMSTEKTGNPGTTTPASGGCATGSSDFAVVGLLLGLAAMLRRRSGRGTSVGRGLTRM